MFSLAAARVALRSCTTASKTTSKLRSSLRQFMRSSASCGCLSLPATAYAKQACSGEQRALATFQCAPQSSDGPVAKEPVRMRRRIIALTCASVVGAAGVATWWLVPTSPAPAEAAASPAIPVVTAKVGVGDMPLVTVGLGTVAAYNTVNMRSHVTRTIQKVRFFEGPTGQPGTL